MWQTKSIPAFHEPDQRLPLSLGPPPATAILTSMF